MQSGGEMKTGEIFSDFFKISLRHHGITDFLNFLVLLFSFIAKLHITQPVLLILDVIIAEAYYMGE